MHNTLPNLEVFLRLLGLSTRELNEGESGNSDEKGGCLGSGEDKDAKVVICLAGGFCPCRRLEEGRGGEF